MSHLMSATSPRSASKALHSRPVPETTNPESYRFAKFGDLGFFPSPFAQPFECPSLLVVSHRVPRSRQNRLVRCSRVAAHRRCVRMLHQLPKNVFSSRLVSTLPLAITTHPPRCCEDHARLVADKLANGKEPKEARRGCCAIATIATIAMAHLLTTAWHYTKQFTTIRKLWLIVVNC